MKINIVFNSLRTSIIDDCDWSLKSISIYLCSLYEGCDLFVGNVFIKSPLTSKVVSILFKEKILFKPNKMPSSITKIQSLLTSNNIIIKHIYTFQDICMYLEVLCIKNGNKLLVYIPPKYSISANDVDSTINVYELTKFIINNKNSIEVYTGEMSEKEFEEYKKVDIKHQEHNDKLPLEDKLEEKYKRHIVLNNLIEEDEKYLFDLIRQLKRLKYCVENLEYKLSLKYKSYLLCLTESNEMEYFCIKNYEGKDMTNMLVIVNIKDLYNNMHKLQSNINDVYNGVYSVISNTQKSQLKNFVLIMN